MRCHARGITHGNLECPFGVAMCCWEILLVRKAQSNERFRKFLNLFERLLGGHFRLGLDFLASRARIF